MNAESIEQYRRYHRQRIQSQKQALEQKRRRILQHIGKAVAVLEKLGANHAILFGSVLNPNRFHSRSDLDLINIWPIVFSMPFRSYSIRKYLGTL